MINMFVVENCCRHVLNAKSLGKELKDEFMAGVVEKNIEDGVPLRGRGL